MEKVITYGTFDLLHWGHIRLLERARALGDHLTVVLSTDEFNQLKGKEAFHNFEQRKYLLEAIKHVDVVIPETTWDQKITDIQSNEINIFVMGDDWEGQFDFLTPYCDVCYLERTKDISTTYIKEQLAQA
ncbi:glycerol-3-phosphate cytidylyltransferase [Listeria booriae]|uniref:Glycerol-3-phosphate cytidylyltransferase n=1 Tax=Listeria booriae TaxID=1552123 RepID=A0A7X0XE46_9LIST|nr:glycerol-3-phosphate cytidylyltransferase [Listeria booriae]MBC1336130.1 glycerol-3-phosphate cytidylyltransferase [Listeria booriae]MBC1492546.1 glycerol-3-phosphate cytidylyltransferase [Listeria booriae]MBC1504465.1 glycerol-3-phosphate cytidylyltransferase [Listeria booriae]MBC1513341.1 glycerol-3-phosphate cytidylyltransferase [Listeria booriae]MBC1522939.1 glycerol-3-phosphate cytidylyltransferase [Listeria booriae]